MVLSSVDDSLGRPLSSIYLHVRHVAIWCPRRNADRGGVAIAMYLPTPVSLGAWLTAALLFVFAFVGRHVALSNSSNTQVASCRLSVITQDFATDIHELQQPATDNLQPATPSNPPPVEWTGEHINNSLSLVTQAVASALALAFAFLACHPRRACPERSRMGDLLLPLSPPPPTARNTPSEPEPPAPAS